MKILYDHQAFTYQNWGGVSKSFCELILHRPSNINYQISIKESDNIHLKDSGLATDTTHISRTLQSFSKCHSVLGREKIYKFLGWTGVLHTAEEKNKKESIQKLREGDFDVFHPTFFDDYFLPYLNGKPFVLTVHDLMPELFGWWKGDPQIVNKPRLLERASAIIAVSENTKNDLCRLYDVPREKVHVVYHGYPVVNKDEGQKRIIKSPYFLYVGRRDGYKNSDQTIRDFGEFHKIHPEVKYVFTGCDFTMKEKALISACGIEADTIHLFADDEQMASLYRHAVAFVFPSLYEGFGMPILEAFAYECPVLLNNKSCFPEIGGDAAIYFDSHDGKSNLGEKLEEVYVFSERERQGMIEKGKKQLEMFSWEKSAKKLSEIYSLILNS